MKSLKYNFILTKIILTGINNIDFIKLKISQFI